MKTNAIYDILAGFSTNQKKSFLNYLQSPYHNSNLRTYRFVKALFQHQAEHPEGIPDKETLFFYLYGKERAFAVQKVYDYQSYVQQHLNRFLALEAILADPNSLALWGLQGGLKWGGSEFFVRMLRKCRQLLLNSLPGKLDFHLQEYFLSRESDHFFLKQQKRNFDPSLNEMGEHLDRFYLASKLRHACEMLNRKNVIQGHYEMKGMPQLLDLLKTEAHYLQDPTIALYHCIYQTLREPTNAQHFHKLNRLLTKHLPAFPRTEAEALIDYLQNYCVRQINQGNDAYLKSYFRWDQVKLEKGWLLVNGQLDHRRFKNMITVGLRLEEYKWVEEFLEQYRHKLDESYRETAYAYNLAAWYFEKKQFRDAQRLLWKVDTEDVYYQLGTRVLLLKIYFELDDPDGIDAQVRAFRAFLKRNRHISRYQHKVHSGLIRYTQRLARLRNQRVKLKDETFLTQLDQLANEIQTHGEITNLRWLLAKIKQIKTKRNHQEA